MGRPRLPLADVTFAAAMKVYGTMSGRRSTTDIKACEAAGLVERAPAYNTVFKRMEDALFSFNLRTPPSPANTVSGRRIYTLPLAGPVQPDAFVSFVADAWQLRLTSP